MKRASLDKIDQTISIRAHVWTPGIHLSLEREFVADYDRMCRSLEFCIHSSTFN